MDKVHVFYCQWLNCKDLHETRQNSFWQNALITVSEQELTYLEELPRLLDNQLS